ncbi:TRAP transporter small permease subunit [Marinomonas sp. MED121]|uniref:TRAP transporter small permease subunit n=1 Tax=Marinomonas sp. MED121 TaxID=314277 RepID=UPI0003106CC2|nr:TRAP transporter small permease subunit [Marinomonas sp. MED121]
MADANKALVVADKLDNWVITLGKGISSCYALLIIVIIVQVVLRKGFHAGLISLEEIQWYLYGTGVMFGMSYAQALNTHVRVDLFYNKFSKNKRHLVEIIGIIFLLLPFLSLIFYHSLDFVYDSFRTMESSAAPAGLPYRWVIKAVIPLSIGLLYIAVISRLYRESVLLITGESKDAI